MPAEILTRLVELAVVEVDDRGERVEEVSEEAEAINCGLSENELDNNVLFSPAVVATEELPAVPFET